MHSWAVCWLLENDTIEIWTNNITMLNVKCPEHSATPWNEELLRVCFLSFVDCLWRSMEGQQKNCYKNDERRHHVWRWFYRRSESNVVSIIINDDYINQSSNWRVINDQLMVNRCSVSEVKVSSEVKLWCTWYSFLFYCSCNPPNF